MEEAPGLVDLDDVLVLEIAKWLRPKDFALFSLVNKGIYLIINDKAGQNWDLSCRRWYGVSSGKSMFGVECSRDACGHMHALCIKYGSYGLRSLLAWDRIHNWTEKYAPRIARSLNPGVTEEELSEAENVLGVALPASLRALYRVHNGQQTARVEPRYSDQGFIGVTPAGLFDSHAALDGLFGGRRVYNDLSCTSMLPLNAVILLTQTLLQFNQGRDGRCLRVLIGLSFTESSTQMWCKLGSEQFELQSADREEAVETVAAFASRNFIKIFSDTPSVYPDDMDSYVASDSPLLLQQARLCNVETEEQAVNMGYAPMPPSPLMHWFESYSMMLEREYLGYHKFEDGSDAAMIWHFPRKEPLSSTAVTQGIKVQASFILMTQRSSMFPTPSRSYREYSWGYSIRFSLLSGEEQERLHRESGAPMSSFKPLAQVQLLDRRWIIQDGEHGAVDEVSGRGVIGLYPILQADGPEFEYQSRCVTLHSNGNMHGEFTFVEGTIDNNVSNQRVIKAICPDMMFAVSKILLP